jgi:hypothetical protein
MRWTPFVNTAPCAGHGWRVGDCAAVIRGAAAAKTLFLQRRCEKNLIHFQL